jgi:hypothetical protein
MSKIVSTYPVQCPAVDLAHTGFCHELLSFASMPLEFQRWFAGADLTVLIAIVQVGTDSRQDSAELPGSKRLLYNTTERSACGHQSRSASPFKPILAYSNHT